MELLETHFNNIDGNLIYNEKTNTYEMFSNNIGIKKHINYLTFKRLFKEMEILKTPYILESGIASAGTYSTYLFNEYVRKYGGFFWSVDINKSLVDLHKGNMCPATELICDDSVTFFNKWSKSHNNVNVIYLDSYDLDFYNPEPSANHGLAEYKALMPVIKKDTLLLIDDTPISPYWLDYRNYLYNDMCKYYNYYNRLPGKGMFILDEITNATKLIHNYQVLYKFNDTPIIKNDIIK
jgi:hypothetical protein